MPNLFITGDMHGEKARFTDPSFHIEDILLPGDTLLICGDFKFIFDDDKRMEEDAFLDELERKPYTILFCDGNHENFDRLESYPVESWNGGYIHRIRKNILHLMRGQIFDFFGKSFFVMGGGCSFGLDPCIEGKTWWKRESPDATEYRIAIDNLNKRNNHVDYVITHTVPISVMRQEVPHYVSDPLNYFLEWLQDHVHYQMWYYGHIHLDKQVNEKQTAVYYQVLKIEAESLF